VKKLLLALAIILPVTAHAEILAGQTEQCRQLYAHKASVYTLEAVCEKVGSGLPDINEKIKLAQCPAPSQRDIEFLLSIYALHDNSVCDT
jgi:hypothetical protein